MLAACQTSLAAGLQYRTERLHRQRRRVRTHVGPAAVQRGQRSRTIAIVGAVGLQVQLPAVTRDGHLHDLGGAFVDGRDAHVALDLFHHVFARIAVTAHGLDGRIGGCVAGLGGDELGDRAFGVQRTIGAQAAVQPVGRAFDHAARGFQPHGMRHDQLVRVALLLGQRAAALMPLQRIGDGAVHGLPAATQAEGSHHHACVAEDLLRLYQSLAFDTTDQVVNRHLDVVQVQRRGIGQAQAVFVFGMAGREARRAAGHHEPCWPFGRTRQDGREVGNGTIGNPLLAPVDAVAGDLAIDDDAFGHRLQRTQVAAGIRLGGAVGKDHALLGDGAQPAQLLLFGGADQDRVAAQEGGEGRRGQPDVMPGHRLADEIGVESASVHAPVGGRHKHQLHAQLRRVAHRAHGVFGAGVFVVELQLPLRRQRIGDKLPHRVQHHRERVGIKAGATDVAGY